MGLTKKPEAIEKQEKGDKGKGHLWKVAERVEKRNHLKTIYVEQVGFGGSRNLLSLSLFFLHMGALR